MFTALILAYHTQMTYQASAAAPAVGRVALRKGDDRVGSWLSEQVTSKREKA